MSLIIKSARLKRNITRIVPFGIIWLVTGWVFLLIEAAVTGNENPNPDEAISLTLPVFIFASLAVTVVGLMVGFIELVWLEKRFAKHSLGRKIMYKLMIYLVFMFAMILINFPIAASIELGLQVTDSAVWQKLVQYLSSITFVSTIVQLNFSLLLSLLYAGISENLGSGVLLNLFSGKYHQPRREERIFMFLDMKSSTTIAEQLGHIRYFALLQQYYDAMSHAIIDHYGEVYQYIGDEVVISWPLDRGLNNADCIRSFFAIQRAMEQRRDYFMSEFGVFPGFKAGMHYGEVTIGEIGALKREIVFTGDVLNTTARVQGLCKTYKTDLIVTSDLSDLLKGISGYDFRPLGTTDLVGKSEKKGLYAVEILA